MINATTAYIFTIKYQLYGYLPGKSRSKKTPATSAPISFWNTPKLWDGLKGLEQVCDTPQAAGEPRRHAAQDVLRSLLRALAFSRHGMVAPTPLSGGDGEVECQPHAQAEPGQPVRIADLAVFKAEAAGLEVREHRLDAPAPCVGKRGEVAWSL